MTATIAKKEPTNFISGDTVKWTKNLINYLPNDGWVLTYALVSDGNQQTITASDNGDGSHLVNVSAANTSNYKIGIYYWQSYVTKAGERYSVGDGRLEVKPNFVNDLKGRDSRSHVRKVLDSLEATLLGKATKDQMAYTINGYSLNRMEPAELIKWKNHYELLYKNEVSAENSDNGGNSARLIKVRFNNG